MFSNELVCQVIDLLNVDINQEITIDELSVQLYFDKTYIMKRFKKELNITIHQYINSIRVLNSLDLFQYNKSFLSIGMRNGFNSLEYFSETFRKEVGVSPSTFKKFILRNKNITEEQENIIINNMNRLLMIKKRVDKYLLHRKPIKPPVKKIGLY